MLCIHSVEQRFTQGYLLGIVPGIETHLGRRLQSVFKPLLNVRQVQASIVNRLDGVDRRIGCVKCKPVVNIRLETAAADAFYQLVIARNVEWINDDRTLRLQVCNRVLG